MTNVKSLLEMYVKMGGSLTDTYSDIAGGVPVGQYSTISDAILACSKKYSSGGGAEKFVVTLIQESDTWTADESVADVLAAKSDGKDIVCTYESSDYGVIELPLVGYSEDNNGVFFGGNLGTEEPMFCNVFGMNDEPDIWFVFEATGLVPEYSSLQNGKVLGVDDGDLAWVDNYAPLVVTLTAGQEADQFVGDKTYEEAYDAFIAGCNVVFFAPSVGLAETVKAVEHSTNYVVNTDSFTCEGSANDYITVTVGG